MSKRLPLIRNITGAAIVLVAAGLLGFGDTQVASNGGQGWIFGVEMRQALIGFASALLATTLVSMLLGRGQGIASRLFPQSLLVGRFLRRVVNRIIGVERAGMMRPWFSAALWVPAAIAAGTFRQPGTSFTATVSYRATANPASSGSSFSPRSSA